MFAFSIIQESNRVGGQEKKKNGNLVLLIVVQVRPAKVSYLKLTTQRLKMRLVIGLVFVLRQSIALPLKCYKHWSYIGFYVSFK